MHIRAAGDGGTPLVLLHPTPQSSSAFRRVLPLLAEDRLTLAVDRIGCGFSDPLRAPSPLADHAMATLDALDELRVAEFDIVGMHTGSVEAIELATTQANRVRRLALVSVPLWTEAEGDDLIGELEANARLSDPSPDGSHLVRLWNLGRDWGEGGSAHWTSRAAPTQRGWPPEVLNVWTLNHLLAGPNWWWIARAVADYPVGDRLPTVTQPLLLIRLRDRLWRATAKAQALAPKSARYLELPDLDQEAFVQAPSTMATHLRTFFAGQ